MDRALNITPLPTTPLPAKKTSALWSIGFRPFFLLAALLASLSILRWMSIYLWHMPIDLANIPLTHWHAHEMLYGFGLAVIAGFLLTAVQNWTKEQTLHDRPLILATTLWVIPRILLFLGAKALILAAITDIAFILLLFTAITKPILKTKNTRQLPILTILLTLCAGNITFYIGAFTANTSLTHLSIHGGIYLIIGLILFMLHRLFPFFTNNAIPQCKPFQPYPWIARLTAATYLLWILFHLIIPTPKASITFALLTGLLLTLRLTIWHRKGLWTRPLIWSLYLALLFITLGAYLNALATLGHLSIFISIHALTYGGMGLSILGMMARVSLGHTGRNVKKPPKTVTLILTLLLIGAIIRILPPLLDPSHYLLLINLSQTLWVAAFTLFLITYSPLLYYARPDGKTP